jgi:hypothetical protein
VRVVGGLASRQSPDLPALLLEEAFALECSEEKLVGFGKKPDEWTEVVAIDCMFELVVRTVGEV